jgi:amino acid adenylation domain-containing protein
MADGRARMLATLLADQAADGPSDQEIVRRGQDRAPLSFAQRRLWFLDQLAAGSPFYVEAAAIEIPGPVRRRALERSINAVVARHEILRTTFDVVEGEPLQRIAPTGHVALPLIDLSAVAQGSQRAAVAARAAELAAAPFDLTTGPLIRTELVRLRPDAHVFLLAIHHIVSDGWSMQIFGREVSALYESLLAGTPVTLPELPIQYADFAAWQRQAEHEAVFDAELQYWRNQLEGLEQLTLPLDHPRPAVLGYRGSQLDLVVPAGLAARLRRLCQAEGVTPFMVTLAAWALVLGRHAGQSDVAVGVPIAGRERPEVEHLIGCLLNTLVLRLDLSGDPTGRELLSRCRTTAIAAYAHQEVPFERLVEELQPVRDLGLNPLFQVMFQYFSPVDTPGGVGRAITVPRATAVVDLFLHLWDEGAAIRGKLEFSTELFDAPAVARLARHLVVVLGGLADDPDRPISTLPMASAAERAEVRTHASGAAGSWGEPRPLDQLFADRAAKWPERLALRADGGAVTYAQLDGRAGALANVLRSAGVRAGDVVAIELPRSIDAVASLLAVASIGATWVCVEPEHPADLVAYMLDDSGAAAVVRSRTGGTARPSSPTRPAVIDVEDVGQQARCVHARDGAARNPTCLIYTSGSTGRPKAVMADPGAIFNRLSWMWNEFPFGPDEIMVHKTALGFVDAIWEIMGPLLAGVPAVIIPEAGARDPVELIDRLAAARATRVLVVPSQLRALLDCGREIGVELPALRTWFTSGESLPLELARRFFEFVPHAQLINLYGSSEVAGDVSSAIRGAGAADAPVTIGRPIANTTLRVLDEHGEAAPIGVPGRLYVGGANVARGYWRRPGLTAERFVPDPYATTPGARMYDTGDRARWREGGELEFLGRADRQIKLRGHRIELEEVERVLLDHGAVDAVVAAPIAAAGIDQLVAFVVGTADPSDLRTHARHHLPKSMVPDRFVMVGELPRRPNGKLDRVALGRFVDGSSHQAEHVAPRTEIEQEVAEMWGNILRVDRVSMTDNFFDVGGHSLLATRLVSFVRERLGIAVPLQAVFEHPTAGELAAVIDAALVDDAPAATEGGDRR